MMAKMTPLTHLFIALLVLMVDSALEMAFISSIVGYLHRSGANQYPFSSSIDGSIITLNAKPKHLEVNQGHTSNGAAGTALVGVSFGGFIVLWWMRRRERMNHTHPSKIFLAYTLLTTLSFLLTLSALAYTFIIGHRTSNQSIDPTTAKSSQNEAYPDLNWAPGTWTKAILKLDLVHQKDRDYLNHWLNVMGAYEWNLIPLFVIGFVVAGLAIRAALWDRKRGVRKGDA